jgi:hypothetical protein
MERMISLGVYRAHSDEKYEFIYYPKRRSAQALGPITQPAEPELPVAYKIFAATEDEARKLLIEHIGPGYFI